MKLHTLKGYINNIFLAEYDSGILLLDGASPADLELIEDFCINTLKRPVTDIKLSVVSHMHPDHSGAAPLLRKKYGIPIAAYKLIDPWYSGITGWFQHKLDCIMAQIVALRHNTPIKRIFSQRITRPDFLVNDGDALFFFEDWKVVYVPGHTLHDIALFNSKTSMLYAADSIVMVKNKYTLPLPVIFQRKMKNSYKKPGDLNAKTILLPHGEIIETESSKAIFSHMHDLVDMPPNKIMKRVYFFSIWSPNIWKTSLKEFLD
jgi:glyoxylase-like metal-dependent hydrolase (beta-lactamase superfamily II)